MSKNEERNSNEDIESRFNLFPNTIDTTLSEPEVVGVKAETKEKNQRKTNRLISSLKKLGILGTFLGIFSGEAVLLKSTQDTSSVADRISVAKDMTERAERVAFRNKIKRSIVSSEEPFALDWNNSDPDEINSQLNALLTNENGQVDYELKNKIDIGEVLLAQFEAEGKISHETALMAREKRIDFKKMAETEPVTKVMHEIAQEHKHYNPTTVSLEKFVQSGEGNCVSSSVGFVVYLEAIRSVYPNMEIKLQSFSGKYVGHVRVLVTIEGQTFALEKPSPTLLIEIEPGTVVEPASNLVSLLAGLRTVEQNDSAYKSELLVPGEVKMIDGDDTPKDETKLKEAEELKKPKTDGVIEQLLVTSKVQPTANYSNDVPTAHELPTITYQQVQKQLSETDPVHARIIEEVNKKTSERRLEKKYTDITKKVFTIQSRIKTSGLEINQQQEAELLELFTEAEKINKLDKLEDDLNEINDQLKDSELLTQAGLEPLKIEGIAKKTLDLLDQFNANRNIDLENTRLIVDQKYIQRILTEKESYLRDSIDDAYLHYGIKLTLNNLNTLSKIAQARWKIESLKQDPIHSLTSISLEHTILSTINAPWFNELPIGYPGSLSLKFRSHDRDLGALERFGNQYCNSLDVDAPLEDFSALKNIKMVRSPVFRNISSHAKLETLDYDEKTDGNQPIFVNPPAELSFKALDIEFKGRIRIELDNYNTLTLANRSPDQLQECRELTLDLNYNTTDLSALIKAKNIKILYIDNPNYLNQNWSFLNSLPENTQVRFLATNEDGDNKFNFLKLADAISFSKKYPNIILTIPVRSTWEVYLVDGKDNLPANDIIIENGTLINEYNIEPYGEFVDIQAELLSANIHNNNEYETDLESLAKLGRLDEVVKTINTKSLNKDQSDKFIKTVDKIKTNYEKEMIHEQLFTTYKAAKFRSWFEENDPIEIEPDMNIIKDSEYMFIPNDSELQELVTQINMMNRSKNNKQTKLGLYKFDLYNAITDCDSLWFQNMPLDKEVHTFRINTPSATSYDFLAIKLKGHKVKTLIVENIGHDSNFLEQINKINFDKLIIISPSPDIDFTKLSPEIMKKIEIITFPPEIINRTTTSDILN